MKSKTTFIYVLVTEEEPNNVRYVGKSNNPDDRIKRHLQDYYLQESTYKNNWLKSELKKGNTPVLKVVDEVPIDSWQFWETYWIEQFSAWGFNLTNGTTGGEGLILNKDLVDKRSKTRMDNTALKMKDEIKLYNIIEKQGLWHGDRVCRHCGNIVTYQKEKRADLMKIIRRAINEDRFCENCWSNNVTFFGKNGFGTGEENPNFNGNKGKDNPFYGKSHSEKTLQLLKDKSKRKKVLQINLEGDVICEYNSIREAQKETGINRRHISGCCNNHDNYNTAGGFKWEFN